MPNYLLDKQINLWDQLDIFSKLGVWPHYAEWKLGGQKWENSSLENT